MEQVDSHLAEQESLKRNLEAEQKRHSELGEISKISRFVLCLSLHLTQHHQGGNPFLFVQISVLPTVVIHNFIALSTIGLLKALFGCTVGMGMGVGFELILL
jgi:hypothetical protein